MQLNSVGWKRICRVGFAVQVVAVVTIATMAWVGIVPTRLGALPHGDLVGHASLIGLLGFFLDGAIGYRRLFRRRVPWLRVAPVVVLAVAGLEEYLQRYGVHRTSSWLDFGADAVGVFALSWVSRRIAGTAAGRTRREAESVAKVAAGI